MIAVTSSSAPYVLIGGAVATVMFFRSMNRTTDFIAKMLCLGAALWALNKTFIAFSFIKDVLTESRPRLIQRETRQPTSVRQPSTSQWIYTRE